MILQYKKVGPCKDYLFGERGLHHSEPSGKTAHGLDIFSAPWRPCKTSHIQNWSYYIRFLEITTL